MIALARPGRAACAVVVLACATLVDASAGQPRADDAGAWIARMMEATRTLNYLGTFVYRRGDLIESMRIVHRADESGERERLVSLTGAAREVLRDEDRVTCILPDDQSVMVSKRGPKRGFKASPVLAAADGFARHYVLSAAPGHRVAGRVTREIRIEPRDAYRYGYRLSLDEATGLLLKSELIAEHGAALEEIVYTTLELPERIPDAMLEPETTGEGYTWTRGNGAAGASEADGVWRATDLPEGFALRETRTEPIGRRAEPVQHLVYGDGLASVSIYVERLGDESERLEGLSAMGAVNAYGTVVGRHHVTVVGEVPARTVEMLGRSIRRQ